MLFASLPLMCVLFVITFVALLYDVHNVHVDSKRPFYKRLAVSLSTILLHDFKLRYKCLMKRHFNSNSYGGGHVIWYLSFVQ